MVRSRAVIIRADTDKRDGTEQSSNRALRDLRDRSRVYVCERHPDDVRLPSTAQRVKEASLAKSNLSSRRCIRSATLGKKSVYGYNTFQEDTVPGLVSQADIGTAYLRGEDVRRISEWLNRTDEFEN